jgi:apolipoprotein N-acyltransferase
MESSWMVSSTFYPSSVIRLLLFITSAVMLTVIQPPISLSALAWIAFVPFIIASSPDAKPWRLFIISFIVSLGYWLGNLYWVFPITIIGWFAVCVYTALLWPALALTLRYCRMKKVPLFLAAAVLVVGTERMQGLFLGGFFWRFLAHSQFQNITLIQIADIFGAGGVSFVIAMVNGLIAELFLDARQIAEDRRLETEARSELSQRDGIHSTQSRPLFSVLRPLFSVIIVVAVLIATIYYGRWRIGQEEQFVENGPMVASLQSNVPQSVKRTFESGTELFEGLMEKSKAASDSGAELIVWPETMVQGILDSNTWPYLVNTDEYQAYDTALKEFAKDNAYILVGAYGGEIKYYKSEPYLARYNSAFLYLINGQRDGKRYDKIHLVPFGEFLPFKRKCQWLYNLLMKFTPYNYDYSLDAGSRFTVFDMTGSEDPNSRIYNFGVMICYEDSVPEIARKFALNEQGQKRLNWIVNISNDGWFVRFKNDKILPSTELAQHTAICAFRAVENRLAIVRSVNTGISCLIDSYGRIRNGYAAGTLPVKALDRTGMSGWFSDTVPIDKRATFFSKYGELLDFCCETLVILLIILMILAKIFRTKKNGILFVGKPNGKHARKS